jgi:hypothetical protein
MLLYILCVEEGKELCVNSRSVKLEIPLPQEVPLSSVWGKGSRDMEGSQSQH